MKILMMMSLLLMQAVQAENVGLSAYDFSEKGNYLTAELLSRVSGDTGMGFQARFTHVASEIVKFDAGYAFSSGDRDHHAFMGADWEIIPDYKLQPRISIKALVDVIEDDGDFSFLAGLAPIISKGVSFGGLYTYPFLALPVRRLVDNDSKFEITMSAGTTVRLGGSTVLNFEGNLNLRNSSSSLLLGLSTTL